MTVNIANSTLHRRYMVSIQGLERITVARQKIHIKPRHGFKALVPGHKSWTSTEKDLHLETAPPLSLPEH